MNWSFVEVADVPPTVVTWTSTVPVPAGAVAVNEVSAPFTTMLVAGLGPKPTAAPLRLVPLTVTVIPPTSGPAGGLTEVTVGAGTYVN